jgi:hypothetical protein
MLSRTALDPFELRCCKTSFLRFRILFGKLSEVTGNHVRWLNEGYQPMWEIRIELSFEVPEGDFEIGMDWRIDISLDIIHIIWNYIDWIWLKMCWVLSSYKWLLLFYNRDYLTILTIFDFIVIFVLIDLLQCLSFWLNVSSFRYKTCFILSP